MCAKERQRTSGTSCIGLGSPAGCYDARIKWAKKMNRRLQWLQKNTLDVSVSSTLADVHRALPGLAMRWHCASAGETFSCRSTTAMLTFRDSLVYICDHLCTVICWYLDICFGKVSRGWSASACNISKWKTQSSYWKRQRPRWLRQRGSLSLQTKPATPVTVCCFDLATWIWLFWNVQMITGTDMIASDICILIYV